MIIEIIITVTMALTSAFGMVEGDTMTVDRFEGDFVVVEVVTEEGIEFHDVHIEPLTLALGEDVSEGDIITYQDGRLSISEEKTNEQRETIAKLIERLRSR